MIDIYTDRLHIRYAKISDADDVQEYFNNWEIIKWLRYPVPYPYPEDGALTYLQNEVPKIGKELYKFAILEKSTNKVIGLIRYEMGNINGIKHAERGFSLSEDHWHKGIMNEASTATNDFMFKNTDIDRIIAYNAKSNDASANIKKKQGFVPNGYRTTESPYHNGDEIEQKWFLSRENHLNLIK